MHIHVDWNQSPLYDEDHEMDQSYDSDLTYNLGWNMPSFSPAGFYNVTIIATGESEEKADQKVMCVLAWMDLNWGFKKIMHILINDTQNNFNFFDHLFFDEFFQA